MDEIRQKLAELIKLSSGPIKVTLTAAYRAYFGELD